MAKLKENSLILKVGDKLKIGRREHEIKPGDYILDNGASHQFIPGDHRTLYYFKSGRYNQSATSEKLPEKLIKAIDFSVMGFVEKSPEESRTRYGLKYYLFQK